MTEPVEPTPEPVEEQEPIAIPATDRTPQGEADPVFQAPEATGPPVADEPGEDPAG